MNKIKLVNIGGYKNQKRGNKKKFSHGELVGIGDGRKGNIVDFYTHEGVNFYRIAWCSKTQPFSWHQSLLIRKV